MPVDSGSRTSVPGSHREVVDSTAWGRPARQRTRDTHYLPGPRPCGLCLSLSRALGAQLAGTCVIVLSAATSRQKRKGEGPFLLVPEGRGLLAQRR
jgi:hypothetical protein